MNPKSVSCDKVSRTTTVPSFKSFPSGVHTHTHTDTHPHTHIGPTHIVSVVTVSAPPTVLCVAWCCSGRTLDLRSTGRGFDSRPTCLQVQPWASCSHMCLCHQAVSFGTSSCAGKVTIGLVSHWPCIAGNSGSVQFDRINVVLSASISGP